MSKYRILKETRADGSVYYIPQRHVFWHFWVSLKEVGVWDTWVVCTKDKEKALWHITRDKAIRGHQQVKELTAEEVE